MGAAKGIATEVVTNGTVVDLTGKRPEIVEYIETGRVYLDGNALVGAMDGVIRARLRMAMNGHVMITVIVDETGAPLGEAWAEVMGLAERGRNNTPLVDVLEEELGAFLDKADTRIFASDEKMDDAIKRIVRQVTMEEIGKKPEVTVVISRLTDE